MAAGTPRARPLLESPSSRPNATSRERRMEIQRVKAKARTSPSDRSSEPTRTRNQTICCTAVQIGEPILKTCVVA